MTGEAGHCMAGSCSISITKDTEVMSGFEKEKIVICFHLENLDNFIYDNLMGSKGKTHSFKLSYAIK